MHVLTKIFVVLVSLLAIMLTPLVVVYTHNEDSYKQKFQAAEAQAAAANTQATNAQSRAAVDAQRAQAEIDRLQDLLAQKQQLLDRAEGDARTLSTDLAASRRFQGDLRSQLASIAESVSNAQAMNENLIGEVRTVRGQALDAERRRVEIDVALADANSRLEVAEAARRMLEEELHRVSDDLAASLGQVRQYASRYGRLDESAAVAAGVLADRDIEATIVNLTQSSDGRKLAEINAGSRDGVEEGWVFLVADNGFVANLRIVRVDIDRSTGIVELEQGKVTSGQRAYVRAGE